MHSFLSRRYVQLWLAVSIGGVAGGVAITGEADIARGLVVGFCSIVALRMLIGMVGDIRRGKYGVDILAVTAIASTLVVGEQWASLVIVIMMLSGEALETYASERARRELTALMDRVPTTAHLHRDGEIVDVPIDQVAVDDVLTVSPGEVIPVDATVITGESLIDESSLTGESEPVAVRSGDRLMSGAVNGESPIVIRALHQARDSQYAQIVELVRAAGDSRAPFVRMADRYAVPFTLVAFVIAGIAWAVSGEARRFAEVLVVATPCPLLLGAPIAMISGMSRSAKRGIIVKSGTILETLSHVQTAAFDKTGTLTMNELSINAIHPIGVSESEFLTYVAAAEKESVHMTALAIVAEAKRRRLTIPDASGIKETPGKGIEVTVDGRHIIAGRQNHLIDQGIDLGSASHLGNTATHVARDGVYIGYVSFADTVRSNSCVTLERLADLGVGEFVMVTGDNRATAERIAHELGIGNVHAECLPKDKLETVRNLSHRPVMMVGDGVNDAPVLASSDVGIAMGARGATAASESADVVIMLDDISRVADAISIAQRTIRIARQSVLMGGFVSIGLMIVASTGVIPAVIGAGLQEIVDVAVILNALRAHRG